jgi:hypothetical protein
MSGVGKVVAFHEGDEEDDYTVWHMNIIHRYMYDDISSTWARWGNVIDIGKSSGRVVDVQISANGNSVVAGIFNNH